MVRAATKFTWNSLENGARRINDSLRISNTFIQRRIRAIMTRRKLFLAAILCSLSAGIAHAQTPVPFQTTNTAYGNCRMGSSTCSGPYSKSAATCDLAKQQLIRETDCESGCTLKVDFFCELSQTVNPPGFQPIPYRSQCLPPWIVSVTVKYCDGKVVTLDGGGCSYRAAYCNAWNILRSVGPICGCRPISVCVAKRPCQPKRCKPCLLKRLFSIL